MSSVMTLPRISPGWGVLISGILAWILVAAAVEWLVIVAPEVVG